MIASSAGTAVATVGVKEVDDKLLKVPETKKKVIVIDSESNSS